MQMNYRSHGGLNGRGGIIRPYRKVAKARVPTELETTSQGVHNQPIERTGDNHNQQSESHITIDDILGHEDVDVDQGITRFGNRKEVNVVVETSYKTYFKGPYNNWGVNPVEVKDRWWNAFKHEFSWDPSLASLVKKE
ncbi:Paired box protein Pax-2a [Bienertia sinuspersici]